MTARARVEALFERVDLGRRGTAAKAAVAALLEAQDAEVARLKGALERIGRVRKGKRFIDREICDACAAAVEDCDAVSVAGDDHHQDDVCAGAIARSALSTPGASPGGDALPKRERCDYWMRDGEVQCQERATDFVGRHLCAEHATRVRSDLGAAASPRGDEGTEGTRG